MLWLSYEIKKKNNQTMKSETELSEANLQD